MVLESSEAWSWLAARVEAAVNAAIAVLVADWLHRRAGVEREVTRLVVIATAAAIMWCVVTRNQLRRESSSLRLSTSSETSG